MEDKKEKLEKLIERNEELRPIVSQGFKTDRELDNFKRKNHKTFEEYYDNQDEIEKLRYELLSPQEKENYDEYRRLSKLKAEGKPLI